MARCSSLPTETTLSDAELQRSLAALVREYARRAEDDRRFSAVPAGDRCHRDRGHDHRIGHPVRRRAAAVRVGHVAGVVRSPIEDQPEWTCHSAISARCPSRSSTPPSCSPTPRRQAEQRGFDRFPIVDVDAHHYELELFDQILEYFDEPVLQADRPDAAPPSGRRASACCPAASATRTWAAGSPATRCAGWGARGARHPSRRQPRPPLDGRDGHRRRGPVPVADAPARTASAGRGRDRDGARLQSLAG